MEFVRQESITQTKPTLRMDDELIGKAQKYAAKRDKSISGMVADYFATITDEITDDAEVTQRVRGLDPAP